MLSQPSALALANAPDHVSRLFQAIHQDTWFIVDDQLQNVVRTELGSRPGDGFKFADVIFGFLWGKVLRTFEKDLLDLNFLDHYPADSGLLSVQGMQHEELRVMLPHLGPTWMDDECVCTSAEQQ